MISSKFADQSPEAITGRDDLFSRQDVRRVLQIFKDQNIEEIVPQLGADGGIAYPSLAEATGIGSKELAQILEALANEKVLISELTAPAARCPFCDSQKITQSLVCPACGGTELMSGEALQHNSCLYLDFESSFKQAGKLGVCPKCHRELGSVGKDYVKAGAFFKCSACGEFTPRAKKLYNCQGCQQVFETAKESLIQTFKYRINKDKRDIIDACSLDLRPILSVLKKDGWSVSPTNQVLGKSGAMHPFTLIIEATPTQFSAGAEQKRELVAVDVATSEYHVEAVPVLSLFAKTLDCRLKNRALIAIPKLSDQARILVQSYGISSIEAGNLVLAAEDLPRILKSFDPKHDAKGMEEASRKSQAGRRRSSIDIMVDILTVASNSSSKSEIMACANLSYEQCQKYVANLEKLGLLRKYFGDGIHIQYFITEKGRDYLSGVAGQFGSIAHGEKSVWGARRHLASAPRWTET